MKMAKTKKPDMVECPSCGALIPLEHHPTENASVAYHNCGKHGNRPVLYIPHVQVAPEQLEMFPVTLEEEES
jgi:hypothetical protein